MTGFRNIGDPHPLQVRASWASGGSDFFVSFTGGWMVVLPIWIPAFFRTAIVLSIVKYLVYQRNC